MQGSTQVTNGQPAENTYIHGKPIFVALYWWPRHSVWSIEGLGPKGSLREGHVICSSGQHATLQQVICVTVDNV